MQPVTTKLLENERLFEYLTKLPFKLTNSHIQHGIQYKSKKCPIALAFTERMRDKVEIDYDFTNWTAKVELDKIHIYDHPRKWGSTTQRLVFKVGVKMRDWIRTFDQTGAVPVHPKQIRFDPKEESFTIEDLKIDEKTT